MKTVSSRKILIFLLLYALLWAGSVRVSAAQDPTVSDANAARAADSADSATENAPSITAVTETCTIEAWLSEKAGKYYLFLPGNTDLSALTLQCQGIDVQKVSGGTYHAADGTISSAFTDAAAAVTITAADGRTYTVTAMVSDLPDLMISLKGTDLSTVHKKGKNKKYQGNALTVMDGNQTESYENVELKGRGNTTWDMGDKKPYQIKLEEKASVLGMKAAKKWVLLSNAFDDSLMRNLLAFDTADQLEMAWTPSCRSVNLWIDGDYRGTYLLCEKVEIDNNRLQLSDPEGLLVELDTAYYKEEDYWFKTSLYPFAVKESVSDEKADIEAGMQNFRDTFEGLMNYLSGTDPEEVTLTGLAKYIDVDSFAKYYLMSEYFRCVDAYISSAYFYQDGPEDVIHFGPVWDYDASMGNLRDSTYASAEKYGDHLSAFMPALLCCPAFREYVTDCYQNYRTVFQNASEQTNLFSAQLEQAADMNYTRWEYAPGWTLSTKGYAVKDDIADFADSFEDAQETLKSWLADRDSFFSPGSREFSMIQRSDQLLIRYRTETEADSFRCAVWSEKGGQDDLTWVTLTQDTCGLFTASCPTAELTQVGTIRAAVYAQETIVATARTEIAHLMKRATLKAEDISGKGSTFRITAADAYPARTIEAAVWSEEQGQDGLKWYPMTSGNGGWYVEIPISDFGENGIYYAHVYVDDQFAGEVSFEVPADSAAAEHSSGKTSGSSVGEGTPKITSDASSGEGAAEETDIFSSYLSALADGIHSLLTDAANTSHTD